MCMSACGIDQYEKEKIPNMAKHIYQRKFNFKRENREYHTEQIHCMKNVTLIIEHVDFLHVK